MRPISERAASVSEIRDYVETLGGKERSRETIYSMYGSILARNEWKSLLGLSKDELRELCKRLREMKSGPQYLVRLRSFYKFHERKDLLKYVPKEKMPATDVGPEDIFDVKEINAMLEHAVSRRDRAMFVTALETGGRVAECLSLDVPHLTRNENGGNDGRPWYKIWFHTVKISGEEHYAYIRDPAAVAIMDDWLAHYPTSIEIRPRPLFPSFAPGKNRLTPGGANDVLKAMARRAGIKKNVHMHLLKHTCATRMLRAGTPETIIKKMLGWKQSSKQLARYGHVVNADVESALGLADRNEKPAEILVPTREVPPMPEEAQELNKAREMAQLRKEIETVKSERKELIEMFRQIADSIPKQIKDEVDAMTPAQLAELEKIGTEKFGLKKPTSR